MEESSTIRTQPPLEINVPLPPLQERLTRMLSDVTMAWEIQEPPTLEITVPILRQSGLRRRMLSEVSMPSTEQSSPTSESTLVQPPLQRHGLSRMVSDITMPQELQDMERPTYEVGGGLLLRFEHDQTAELSCPEEEEQYSKGKEIIVAVTTKTTMKDWVEVDVDDDMLEESYRHRSKSCSRGLLM